jgi:hypothetical protein
LEYLNIDYSISKLGLGELLLLLAIMASIEKKQTSSDIKAFQLEYLDIDYSISKLGLAHDLEYLNIDYSI